jgi:hypothetical protein
LWRLDLGGNAWRGDPSGAGSLRSARGGGGVSHAPNGLRHRKLSMFAGIISGADTVSEARPVGRTLQPLCARLRQSAHNSERR